LKLKKNPLELLERAMGVSQHHDAVSGTERQHVANDYAKRLAIGIDTALNNMQNKTLYGSEFTLCQLNISECATTENQSVFAAFLYNPLSYETQSWIRVPVMYNDFQVYDVIGEKYLDSELVLIDKETMRIPERKSNSIYNIVFQVNLPPLEMHLFSFKRDSTKKLNNYKNKINEYKSSFTVKNQYVQYTFDQNGNLNKIDNIESGVSTPLKQLFCFYLSQPGNNSESEFQASGAYIFRPQTDDCVYLMVQNYTIYRGKQVNEIHQVYNDWISQTIRLYDNSRYAEFEWQVGPINVDDQIGKEVIIKFVTDLETNSIFYTDSNGREILKRVRDYRPTWKLNQTEKIAGNYYPINSRIYIKDETANKQFTVVTDRSQGGSSIQDGSVEIMLHRRVLHDDSLGVSEPMNELGSDNKGLIVKGRLFVILDKIENSAKIHRRLAIEINNEPVSFFLNINDEKTKNLETNFRNYRNLNFTTFPTNLHLLTLMRDYDYENANTLIVRLEHFYEINEDSVLSKPVTFDLSDLFEGTDIVILDVEELALGTNMNVDALNERLNWQSQPSEFTKRDYADFEASQNLSVSKQKLNKFSYSFSPMQIRTFRIYISYLF